MDEFWRDCRPSTAYVTVAPGRAALMDPLDLLIRGVVALAVMGLLMAAARLRFRGEHDRGAPTDIGLD